MARFMLASSASASAILALVVMLGLLMGSSSATHADVRGGHSALRKLMQASGGFPYPETCIIPARVADASPYSLTLYSADVGSVQSTFCFIVTDSANPSFFASGQIGACKRQLLDNLYQILIGINPQCRDNILSMTVNGETRDTWSLAYGDVLLQTGPLGLSPNISAVGTTLCFTVSAPCQSLPNLLNSKTAKISYAMTESSGSFCCPGETKSAALSTLPKGPNRQPPTPPPMPAIAPGGSSPPVYPINAAPGGSSPPVYPINVAPGGSSPPVYPIDNAPGGSSPPVYPINVAPGGSAPPVYPINAPGSENPPVYPINAPGSNAPEFVTVPADRLPDFNADTARLLTVTYSILGSQTFLQLSSGSDWQQLQADLIDAIAYATSLDSNQIWILEGYPQSADDGKSMIVKYSMQANSQSQVILVDFLLYFVSYHPERAFPTEQSDTWGLQAVDASQGAFPVWSIDVTMPTMPRPPTPAPPVYGK